MEYPDTELQNAANCSAEDIARQASEDFEAWRAANEELLDDMSLLEQIDVYYSDCAWHSPQRGLTE